MLLCNRRAVLLGLGALSGCGFEPVFAPGGASEKLRNAVLVDEPTDRASFALVEQLERRLGRPTSPAYRLTVALVTEEEGLAVTGSNDITRYNIVGKAAFTMRNIATGDVVIRDRVDTFTAYSASEQPVATLSAERDARERLTVALADKIVSRLLVEAWRF